jgi:hypothetical protein
MNKDKEDTNSTLITCLCGHWYNTTVECPICKTLASAYHFTTSEKIKALTLRKWYCVEGFCFEVQMPDNVENVIISYEETIKQIKEGTKWYCLQDYGDYFMDLTDAWDYFLDNLYDELETDTETVVLNYVRNLLAGNEK